MLSREFPSSIFKAYDIRGVVGVEWDRHWAFEIGRGIGSMLKERGLNRCVVGRDGRASGEMLMHSLMDGVCLSGIDVLNIGLAATPVAYFAGYHFHADAVLVVTASHNPAEYNGIKIVIENCALAGEAIQSLRDRVQSRCFTEPEKRGLCESVEIYEDYTECIVQSVQISRPLKIAIDCGNGTASLHAPDVFEALGIDVVPLYCKLDGSFPNHDPDPSQEVNLVDLKRVVVEEGCELGLAFDGDGDRVVVVSKEGETIAADRLLMLFAESVLRTCAGRSVVYDVKCTRALAPWVKSCGGVPVLARTGHSYMKEAMRASQACVGGELSGHFFFADRWYGFDDGLYAAVRLLELISDVENPSLMLHSLPNSVTTPELYWRFKHERAMRAVMTAITENVCFPKAECIHRIDGLRVEYSDGFGLIRPSNTLPAITLRFEGDTAEALAAIQADFLLEIGKVCGQDEVKAISDLF